MIDWPHGPVHRLDVHGTYMVTAATYLRQAFFKSPEHLSILLTELFSVATEHSAALQAWAVFPNHYHFIAHFDRPADLRDLARHRHSVTREK